MKANRKKPQAAPRPSADKKREGAAPRLSRHAGRITAASVFLLFFLFSTMVYGDMLRRTAEANFITADSEQMKHLTDQTLGYLYVAGRWALLAFKNVWAGGALLALVLTLTALGANRLMGRKLGAWGAGAVVPAAVVGWMLWRGTNLWFRNEPSLFILLAVAAMLAVGAALLVKRLVVGRKAVPEPAGKGLRGLVVPVAAVAALSSAALTLGDNDIRTARMQLATMRGDWEALVDDGLAARRPTRAVAAYYAIGLAQTDQLLTRLFDIPYDYPDARIDRGTSGGEYGLFVADGNYFAGLLNAGYRAAMDQVVMGGPNLYYLKRMAVCAIAMGERELALKYLRVIGSVPFEGGFVERYRPLAESFEAARADAEIGRVLALRPLESRFEQQYRQPAFLGYNTGLQSGSDETLVTSIAACLYSKELPQAMQRISIYTQKFGTQLPLVLQQAICIASTKVGGVEQQYGDIIRANRAQLMSFVTAAKPLLEGRAAELKGKTEAEQQEVKNRYNARLREGLAPDWLGSYYYYYYCENNDQRQVSDGEKHGVN